MKKNITVSLIILVLLFSGCSTTYVVKKPFLNSLMSSGVEIDVANGGDVYGSKPVLLYKNNLFVLTKKYQHWQGRAMLTIDTKTHEIKDYIKTSDSNDDLNHFKKVNNLKEVDGIVLSEEGNLFIHHQYFFFMNNKIWIYYRPIVDNNAKSSNDKVILNFGNDIDSKKNFFNSVNKYDHEILKQYFEEALKTNNLYLISQYIKYAKKLSIYDDSLIHDYMSTTRNTDLNVIYYLWKEGFKFYFKYNNYGASGIDNVKLPNKIVKKLVKTKKYLEMLKDYIAVLKKDKEYNHGMLIQIISEAIKTKNTSVLKYISVDKFEIMSSLVSERKFSLLKQMIDNSSIDINLKKKLQILLLKTGNIEAYIKFFGYKCDNLPIEKIIYPLLHINVNLDDIDWEKNVDKIYDGVKLLKHHPDFYKYRDSNGNNLFLMAAINHNYDLLSELSHYFKINSTNDDGKNAMDYNVHYGLCDTEIANFLTSKGLAPNKKECYPKDYGSVYYKNAICSTSICNYTFHCGTYNMAGSKEELDIVIEAYSDSEDHVNGYSPELTRSCDAHGEYISPLADKICRCVKNKVGLR